jgi:hypothetical protein
MAWAAPAGAVEVADAETAAACRCCASLRQARLSGFFPADGRFFKAMDDDEFLELLDDLTTELQAVNYAGVGEEKALQGIREALRLISEAYGEIQEDEEEEEEEEEEPEEEREEEEEPDEEEQARWR